LSDDDIDRIARLGFTYIRIPVTPDVLQRPDGNLDPTLLGVLLNSIRRVERRGLGAMIVPFHDHMDLERSESDRQSLSQLWSQLAVALGALDESLTFPELLNEPVFRNVGPWQGLEASLVGLLRKSLPRNTIVSSGHRWGSISGLIELTPLSGRNIAYSFHYYDPPTLTSHAAWDKTIDGRILSRLPFPVLDEQACMSTVQDSTDERVKRLGQRYCSEHWNDERIRSEIAKAHSWGREHNVTVIAPEIGIVISHDRTSRANYLMAVRTACEQLGIGWGLWGYDDGFGLGAVPSQRPLRPSLDRVILHALGLNSIEEE
jgi:hypothetical protein